MNDTPDAPPPSTDHEGAKPAQSEAAADRKFRLTGTMAAYAALGLSVVAVGLGLTAHLNAGPNARAYLLEHPEILQEVSQALETKANNSRVDEINAAAAANSALLAPDARDPSFGPTDAKVTVIEFFDFRCPGCKLVADDFRALMKAHPDVRFVFKDWPILDRGEDVTSQYAARAALAAHQQGKYLEVYDALMDEPALSLDSVDRILTENGVDMTRARAAIESLAMTRHVADIHTTASTLRLQGTPTFFVNGKASASINPAEVGALIEAAKR